MANFPGSLEPFATIVVEFQGSVSVPQGVEPSQLLNHLNDTSSEIRQEIEGRLMGVLPFDGRADVDIAFFPGSVLFTGTLLLVVWAANIGGATGFAQTIARLARAIIQRTISVQAGQTRAGAPDLAAPPPGVTVTTHVNMLGGWELPVGPSRTWLTAAVGLGIFGAVVLALQFVAVVLLAR